MAIGTAKVGALVANATTGPITPLYPVGITNKEMVLAFVVGRDANAGISWGGDWQLLDFWNSAPQGITIAVFRRIWTTGDTAVTFSSNSGTGLYGFTMSWTGVNTATVDQLPNPYPSVSSTGTSLTMTGPSVTTRTPGAVVLYLYASMDDNAHGTAGGGSTAIASGASYISTVGGDIAVSAAIEAMPTPGSSGGATMAHASGANNGYLSMAFALRPSVTVTGTVAVPLGPLSATVPNGHVDPTRGTSVSPLGRLTVAVTGKRTTFGTAGKALGALTARAVGIRTTFGTASVSLGELRGNVVGGSVTALGGTDVSLNPSVWLVDRPSQILAPVTGWTRLELSPIANGPGDVGISVGVGTAAFADLHGLVSASPQTDCEIEIWLDGRGRGNNRKRAILYQKSGDDLNAGNVWAFSGHFLEQLLAEVLVGIDNSTESKETFFDGENPGTILATIFDRIQDRHPLLLAGMTRDFTTEYDSNGNLWEEVLGTMKYTPDTTLLEVAQDLVSLATCEFEVTANRVFRAFNFDSRGTDHTLDTAPMRFQHGSNLREASRRESSRVGEAATAVLGKGSEGAYAWATDATAQAQRGRRVESPQDVGRLTSTAAVLAGAEARLFALKTGVQERSHSIAFTPGAPIPMADFDIGDYAMSVAGDNVFERMRIQQWKLVFEPNTVTGDVVMNDLVQDWENLTESRLNAIMRGSTVVGTSPSPPQVDDGKSPNAPSGLVATSQAYFNQSGTTQAAVTASWTAVTTNADFTATDDIASYIPQFRYGVSSGLPTGWNTLPSINHPTSTVDFGGVQPGVSVDMRVAAVDRYSNVGAWSSTYSFTSAADAIAPPVPSVPVVESYLGILRVKWDGRGSFGENMPADFDHVEIHLSTGEGFVPDRPLVNGRLDELHSTTYIDALTGPGERPYGLGVYDTTYYAKLVAVDRTGNYSAASNFGSALLVQVGDGDIAELNVGKLRTGILTAIMTVSGTIRTALTGSRVELDSNGIRCWFGTKKVFDFNINTGRLDMSGKLTAGAGVGVGATIEISPDASFSDGSQRPAIYMFPDATQAGLAMIADVDVRPDSSNVAGFRMGSFDANGQADGMFLETWATNWRMTQIGGGTTVGGGIQSQQTGTQLSVASADGAAHLYLSDAQDVDLAADGQLTIGSGGGNIVINSAGGIIDIGPSSANRVNLSPTGAQLISNNAVKAFVIQHPTDPDRLLVHGCTESPDAEVTYRGTAIVQNGVAEVGAPDLPAYFEALVREDSRTAEAWHVLGEVPELVKPFAPPTPRLHPWPVGTKVPLKRMVPKRAPDLGTGREMIYRAAASVPRAGQFRIASDAPDGTVVHWRVTAVRREAGGFVVEPLKTEVDVHGDGPYRYIVPGKGP
jgi:hypothetical protein